MAGDSCVTQLITRNGIFCVEGLCNFVKTVKLHQCGLSYAVVAIMGPQSSGKSTLLNHLFYTNFKEMEAYKGRFQTTKGVWIAKAIEMEPLTTVMDLEGSDGRERGEDDTTFEKQSTLFALAVADIVLINIWCHDIGREHAANRPLLKIVFQVMMRLFSPRRTTLLFVIRDKTKTPFQLLEPILREDIQKIWEAVSKPDAYKDASLSDFFNVEVAALSSYEDKEEEFKEQVAQLRQQFFHSISPGGLAGDRQGVIPGSGFSVSVEQIWKIIKENKDLDLPAHKIMVATVRCEEIANEKYDNLASDKNWLALERNVQSGTVLGFGRSLSSILGKYLSEYDLESIYFEEGVRNAKHEYLESKALQLVHPTYITVLGHLRSKAVESFKTQLENRLHKGHKFADSVRACQETSLLKFDRGCTDASIEQANWDSDAFKVREKLQRDIEAHSSFVRSHKLAELVATYERQLSLVLSEPVGTLFEAGGSDTWASIRNVLKYQSDKIVSDFLSDISDFELSKRSVDDMVRNLREYARKFVENKAREEAGKVLIRMKDRFATVFNHDKDSMPRVWTGKENIKPITKEAYADSLKLLSTMAVVRLDDRADNVESVLFSNLIDETVPLQNKGVRISADPLASNQWKEVPLEKTLITPMQCKRLWRQFKAETEYTIAQAIAAQEAYKRGKSWLPPPWAIVAMIVLGFNEFMLLLRNPLYILVLFATFFIGKAIWDQYDFPRELENGFLSLCLSGLISLSSKLFDVVMNIMRRISGENYENLSIRHESFRNQTQKSESISDSMMESPGSSSATTGTVCDHSSTSGKQKER